MTCTRCESTGFLNVSQLPDIVIEDWEESGDNEVVLRWIKYNNDHDVVVCDCCGDGGSWHGIPGEHNNWPEQEPFPECI